MHGPWQRKGKNASLCLVMPECNSFGLGLLSAPGLDAAFEDAQAGADVAIVLENDLYRRLQIDEADDFLAAFRPCGRDRPPVSPDRPGGGHGAAGGDLRGRGRDARQQRRPGPALFPGISRRRPGPAELAMAHRCHGVAGASGSADLAQPRRPHRLHGEGGPLARPRGRRRAAGGVPGCGDEDSPRAPAEQRKDGRERGRDRARAAAAATTRTRLSPFPWRGTAEGRLRP